MYGLDSLFILSQSNLKIIDEERLMQKHTLGWVTYRLLVMYRSSPKQLRRYLKIKVDNHWSVLI